MQDSSTMSGKRKRKHDGGRGKGADRGSDDETGASGSDAPRQTMSNKQVAQAALDLKKRTKTVHNFFWSWEFFLRLFLATRLRFVPQSENPL